MNLQIRTGDEAALGDNQGLDETFLVEAELSIIVGNNVIRSETVPVAPYRKTYVGKDSSLQQELEGKSVFLAFLDGAIAGRIILSEGWNRQAWIDDLAVDARHRRAGIGRTLIDRAVTWAVEQGLDWIRAETQSNNVPACKLYEVCGFHLGGFDRNLYRGLDEVTREVALFWYRHLGRSTDNAGL